MGNSESSSSRQPSQPPRRPMSTSTGSNSVVSTADARPGAFPMHGQPRSLTHSPYSLIHLTHSLTLGKYYILAIIVILFIRLYCTI
jgi:hypothetical protein